MVGVLSPTRFMRYLEHRNLIEKARARSGLTSATEKRMKIETHGAIAYRLVGEAGSPYLRSQLQPSAS